MIPFKQRRQNFLASIKLTSDCNRKPVVADHAETDDVDDEFRFVLEKKLKELLDTMDDQGV